MLINVIMRYLLTIIVCIFVQTVLRYAPVKEKNQHTVGSFGYERYPIEDYGSQEQQYTSMLHGGRADENGYDNDFFDVIFADIRQRISVNDTLDPFILPEDSDEFTVTVFNSTLDGYFKVGNGQVEGLGTLHRVGNMSVEVHTISLEVIVRGEVGLTGLEVSYGMESQIGPFSNNLDVSATVGSVNLEFETDFFLFPNQRIELAQCNITDMSALKIKTGGILINVLGNMVTDIFHSQIVAGIEIAVCSLLERALNG